MFELLSKRVYREIAVGHFIFLLPTLAFFIFMMSQIGWWLSFKAILAITVTAFLFIYSFVWFYTYNPKRTPLT